MMNFETVLLNGESNVDEYCGHLLGKIGNAKVICVGEGSHGNNEYRQVQFLVAQKLIEKGDISYVAVEWDWPDCYRINQVIKGYSSESLLQILSSLSRWPRWMWGNEETLAFLEWLKQYNNTTHNKVGFYGLDFFSLGSALKILRNNLKTLGVKSTQIHKYLAPYNSFSNDEQIDLEKLPPVLADPSDILTFLEPYTKIKYSRHTGRNNSSAKDLREEVLSIGVIRDLLEWTYFYYDTNDTDSWNIREQHFLFTFLRIQRAYRGRAIVLAHNGHCADARHTTSWFHERCAIGHSLCQIYNSDQVYRIATITCKGEVMSGKKWGGPTQIAMVPEVNTESWEQTFHSKFKAPLLATWDTIPTTEPLNLPPKKEDDRRKGVITNALRSMGAVYNTEKDIECYTYTELPGAFNAVFFFEHISPIRALKAALVDINKGNVENLKK